MTYSKSIFASKVLWFNLIAGIIAIAQQNGVFDLVPEPWGPTVILLGNMLLRFFTIQPVAITPSPVETPAPPNTVVDPDPLPRGRNRGDR